MGYASLAGALRGLWRTMRIGIVGHEAQKFLPEAEAAARHLIDSLLQPGDLVISGGCHLGGIDAWAVEQAKRAGLPYVEHLPKELNWERGFKPRNILIAQASEMVVSIVVDRLPETYRGMRFDLCYYCGSKTHVKSGGCWTARYAASLGKPAEVLIVRQQASCGT